MPAWIHRTLVCPAHLVDAACELCAAVHPAGAGMFSAPASPDGALPATHWVTVGLVEDTWAPAFLAPEYLFGVAQMGAAAQGLTLTATFADALALLEQGDISDEPWDVAGARLGLMLCSGDGMQLPPPQVLHRIAWCPRGPRTPSDSSQAFAQRSGLLACSDSHIDAFGLGHD